MRTLSFNNITGLNVVNNDLIVITGINALKEKLEERLRFFLGEWFLDTTQGVPYLQEIFEKPVDTGLITSILTGEISKEEDVISVNETQALFEKDTRQFTYSATVETSFGSLSLSTSTETLIG